MKKIFIPLIISVILLSFAGCSGSSGYDGYAAETTALNYSNEVYPAAAPDAMYDSASGASLTEAKEAESQRKIIRNAKLSIQTLNIDETYNKLTAKLFELGGSIHTEQSEKNDFSAYANAVFKLPPENLDAFVAYADECGKVTQKTISSQDITADYIDTEIRLENKRRNLEKYYEYLDEAYTSEDVIMIQREIDQITADIETYQGLINYWNSSVSESQVDIEIRQLQDPNEIEIEDVEFSTLSIENMGKIMSNGIKKCADVIITIFQWLIIIIVTLLPVIAVVAVIIIIIFLRRRHLDKKYPERAEARKLAKERAKSVRPYVPIPASTDNTSTTETANNPGYKKPPQ
ncbi:MAG: DUF4349 domain-containing protein [Ruminococcus sp.]|nr:DUF4349 domain-containing protein [Ruminococcus sp.]